MKVVYIISRHTSANRTVVYHADNGNNQPLCNDQPRGRFNGWAWDDSDENEITCPKCKKIINHKETKMSDPRYSKGVFKGFTPRRQAPPTVTPMDFGWRLAGKNIDGYHIYRLGPAMMRLTTPQEHAETGDDTIVFIDNEPYATYSGPLAEVTADVKMVIDRMAKMGDGNSWGGEAIPFMGEPWPVLEWVDDYGLEAVA